MAVDRATAARIEAIEGRLEYHAARIAAIEPDAEALASDNTRDELDRLAERFGLDPGTHDTKADLAEAIVAARS